MRENAFEHKKKSANRPSNNWALKNNCIQRTNRTKIYQRCWCKRIIPLNFSPLAVSCAWTWAHKLYLNCRWPSKIQSHLMDTMFSFACFTLSRTISNSRGRNKSISIFRRMRFNCATSLELSFSLKMSDICSNGSWKRVEDLLNLLLLTTLNGQRQETCNNIHETILRKVVY